MFLRGNLSRILDLEYSQVTKGYECLEHRMNLLVTCEIMRAKATLHLSGTVHKGMGQKIALMVD